MKKLLTLALCAAAGGLMAAAPLFEKGKSQWKIVIPANASTVNQYAAEEFATAVKKVSGVEIPVVQADTVQGKNNVVIGSLKDEALIGKKAEELKLKGLEKANDTIALYTLDGNLYLAGNNPRSAIYAVYHFLREYVGVRWFWPGDDGEFMPKKDSLTVPAIAYNYQAPIRYRAASPVGNHGDAMIETGTFRMFTNGERLNGKIREKTGAVRVVGTHSVGLHSKDFEKYPERFAVINGKRSPKGIAGCWSNPDFMKMMVERHADWVKRNNADIICAFVADVIERCECAECTKIKDASSRWFTFYGKMVKEIQKQYPDLAAATLAYQEYRSVPEMKVEGLKYVEYCLYNRCYIHKMDDPTCPVNKKALEGIKAWMQKAPMGIYGYEFGIFSKGMYLPMHNQLAATARFFRDMKVARLKTEFPAVRAGKRPREQASYLRSRISGYVFCMTAWNPDLNVEELIKDFCKYVYGAGAESMAEYHITMGKYWDAMKMHITYFMTSPSEFSVNLLNPERIAAMKVLLDKAEKAIAAMPDEAARKRAAADFAVDKHYFNEWEKTYLDTKKNEFRMNLPKRPQGTDFDTLPKLQVTAPVWGKRVARPTDMRMYWSDEGLNFRVILHEAGLKDLHKGYPGRDVPIFQYANIEFFLDLADGQPYRQMGVCLAGGTWDAIASDRSWNPDWKATVKVDEAKDEWSVEVFLPFASFGGKPAEGTPWKINIIRNVMHKNENVCGFPAPVYRDFGKSAMIFFTDDEKK